MWKVSTSQQIPILFYVIRVCDLCFSVFFFRSHLPLYSTFPLISSMEQGGNFSHHQNVMWHLLSNQQYIRIRLAVIDNLFKMEEGKDQQTNSKCTHTMGCLPPSQPQNFKRMKSSHLCRYFSCANLHVKKIINQRSIVIHQISPQRSCILL